MVEGEHTKHGNRLQAGLAATGNRQLDGVDLVLQLLTLHDERFSTFHGIFTTEMSVNWIGLTYNWRTEKKALNRISSMARLVLIC